MSAKPKFKMSLGEKLFLGTFVSIFGIGIASAIAVPIIAKSKVISYEIQQVKEFSQIAQKRAERVASYPKIINIKNTSICEI